MEYPIYQTPCPKDVMEHIFEVKKEQADSYGRMRLSGLAQQMERLTENHLAAYGMDYKSLKEEGKAWVISWTSIYIAEPPKEGNRVILRMWPGKNKSVMYQRKYGFYSETGKPLVSASSLFVMMDIHTRGVAAPTEKIKQIPAITVLGEAESPKMREEMPKSFTKQTTRKVQPAEIDKNGHMNNTCYLDWAEDIRVAENLGEAIPAYVWVQYKKELRKGQEAALHYQITEKELALLSSSDEEDFFALKMRWQEAADRSGGVFR